MPVRLALSLVVVALVAASCGVSREVEATDGTDEEQTADTSAAADAGDEGADTATSVETTAPPTTAPSTTAGPTEVAATVGFGDGTSAELLHGEINDIVIPTQQNLEFVDLVYQGSVPAGFFATVLSQAVVGRVMDDELAGLSASTTDENVEEARTVLLAQLERLLAASADPAADAERLYAEVPYLPFLVGLQARQTALATTLAAGAGEGVGNPCVRHILLETEADAVEVLAELDGGADFAALAAARSTGPTGPAGGDLGCAPAANYVEEFANAVTEAEVGVFVGPVQTQFGWHVLVVERYEVDGNQLANDLLTQSLADATVTVDERIGTWDADRLTIIPVGG